MYIDTKFHCIPFFMKREAASSSLSSLFSDESRDASKDARTASKKVKTYEENTLRKELEHQMEEAIKKVTVRYPFVDSDKAVRKLNKGGLLVIRSTHKDKQQQGNMNDIARLCVDLETRICQRLTTLGIKYQGFSDLSKKDRAALIEDERKQSFQFKEVSSRCLGRLDIKLPLDGVRIDNSSCSWVGTVQSVLGQDCKLAYIGLISSFPGSWNQPFHGDGPHLFGNELQLPMHAINVFIPLHDVTPQLGPTELFLSSNQLETAAALGKCLSSFTSPQQSTTLEIARKCSNFGHVPVQPLLKANRDVLLYDYRSVHRGTANQTPNTVRRMLYLLYTKPWFYDHINFGDVSIFETDEQCLRQLSEQRHKNSDAAAGAAAFDFASM